jgi:hypothetical protein
VLQRLPDDIHDFDLRCPIAQQIPQGRLLLPKQADLQVSICSQSEATATAAEVACYGRDEADCSLEAVNFEGLFAEGVLPWQMNLSDQNLMQAAGSILTGFAASSSRTARAGRFSIGSH